MFLLCRFKMIPNYSYSLIPYGGLFRDFTSSDEQVDDTTRILLNCFVIRYY